MVVHLVEYMDKASRGFGQRNVFGVVDAPAAGENGVFNGEIGHRFYQGDSKGGPHRGKDHAHTRGGQPHGGLVLLSLHDDVGV